MSDQPYRPDPLAESFDAGAPSAGGDPTGSAPGAAPAGAPSGGVDEHVAFPEIPAFTPGTASESGLPASAWSSPMAELDAAGIGSERPQDDSGATAAATAAATAPATGAATGAATPDVRAADRRPPVPSGGPMAPASPRTIPGMQPVSPPVQPPPGTGFGGAGSGGGTRWTPPNRAASPFQTGERRGCGKVVGLVALLLVAPVLIGVFMTIVGAFTHDDEDGGSGSRPAPSTPPPSVVTTIPVQARPVTGIPKTATTMRFEVYGAGRTVELRWYISGKSTRLEDMRLPYAASVPIGEDSDYVALSASDYAGADKNGAGSMECRAYVGDVLVATNVGTTRVECTVSRAQLPASAR